jgi:hypothetical protein
MVNNVNRNFVFMFYYYRIIKLRMFTYVRRGKKTEMLANFGEIS